MNLKVKTSCGVWPGSGVGARILPLLQRYVLRKQSNVLFIQHIFDTGINLQPVKIVRLVLPTKKFIIQLISLQEAPFTAILQTTKDKLEHIFSLVQ